MPYKSNTGRSFKDWTRLVWKILRQQRKATPKLYILVRDDLPILFQITEAARVAAQYVIENQDSAWNNQELVCLNVSGLTELNHWVWKFQADQTPITKCTYHKLDNEMTAVAVYLENGQVLGDLPILSGE